MDNSPLTTTHWPAVPGGVVPPRKFAYINGPPVEVHSQRGGEETGFHFPAVATTAVGSDTDIYIGVKNAKISRRNSLLTKTSKIAAALNKIKMH